jgi:transposase
VAIESIRFEGVPHPPYSPHLAPSDFWLFAALKKHLKGIHYTCKEEMVESSLNNSTLMGSKTCSALAALYQIRGTISKNEV